MHRDARPLQWADREFLIVTGVVVALAAVLCIMLLLHYLGIRIDIGSVIQHVFGSRPSAVLKNLTSEYLYNASSGRYDRAEVINYIRNVTVQASSPNASVGSPITVNVIYSGTFNFANYNSTAYVGGVVNIAYLGFYRQGWNVLLTQGNAQNVTQYFGYGSGGHAYQPAGTSGSGAFGEEFNLTPGPKAAGGDWYFCGGYFLTYHNDTSWGQLFTNMTYYRKSYANSTVVNHISSSCAAVHVG